MRTPFFLALVLLGSCGLRTGMNQGHAGSAVPGGGQDAGGPYQKVVPPRTGETAGWMADQCNWSSPGNASAPAVGLELVGTAQPVSFRVRVTVHASAYAHKGYVSEPSLVVAGPFTGPGMQVTGPRPGATQGEYFFDLLWALQSVPRDGMTITLTASFSFACSPTMSRTIDATATAELLLCRDSAGTPAWRGPGTTCEVWDVGSPDAGPDARTDRPLGWQQIPVAAGFPARARHVGLVFQDKMWILGGEGRDSAELNDVWSSSDGRHWTQGPSAGWSPRAQHRGVVFQNKMWVIDGARKSDVWSSDEGAVWTKVVEPAAFPARFAGQVVAFADRLWLLGGYGPGGQALADVWSSPDGKTWKLALSSAPWGARDLHTCVVAHGRIWLIDGEREGDVWSSFDGTHWEQVTQTAGFPGRMSHSSVSYEDKLWIFGGYGKSGSPLDDVWMSSDGATWVQQSAHAPWGPRQFSAALVFDDKAWVLGGTNGSQLLGDVWTLAPQ